MFADREATLRGRTTWETLAAVIEHYRQRRWRADLVYLTGDLAQDESRGAYRNLRAAIDPLTLPVELVPGNHDDPAFIREELADYGYCSVRRETGWNLIGLNSHQPGVVGGRLGAAELDRLDAVLETDKNRPAAVFLHHPPVQLGSQWLDRIGLEDGDELRGRARNHANLRLLVFGHAHQAFDRSDGSLRILGTPSTGRQFSPGSTEFELDDRPPAYRRLEFGADGSFSTELIWIDNDDD
ncbi:MAG: metallophosphoesterase [Pseudomonadota bacterium]